MYVWKIYFVYEYLISKYLNLFPIGLMVRVLANGPADLGSVQGRV